MKESELDARLSERVGGAPQTVEDFLNMVFDDWGERQKLMKVGTRQSDTYTVQATMTITVDLDLAKAYLNRLMAFEAKRLLSKT